MMKSALNHHSTCVLELVPLQGAGRREREQTGNAGNLRGREGSFVTGKKGIERGKIMKKIFVAGRNRLRDKEHKVHDQDWAELPNKGKIDSISRGQIGKPGKFFSRYQWTSLQAEKIDGKE